MINTTGWYQLLAQLLGQLLAQLLAGKIDSQVGQDILQADRQLRTLLV
jgi:hypothetical protein